MNALSPIQADTTADLLGLAEPADCVADARLAERRLRAAARRQGKRFFNRPADILRRLQAVRRHNERNIVTGPFPHLSMLHGFMRDWRDAIDAECRWSARRASDHSLVRLSKGQRGFIRKGV